MGSCSSRSSHAPMLLFTGDMVNIHKDSLDGVFRVVRLVEHDMAELERMPVVRWSGRPSEPNILVNISWCNKLTTRDKWWSVQIEEGAHYDLVIEGRSRRCVIQLVDYDTKNITLTDERSHVYVYPVYDIYRHPRIM